MKKRNIFLIVISCMIFLLLCILIDTYAQVQPTATQLERLEKAKRERAEFFAKYVLELDSDRAVLRSPAGGNLYIDDDYPLVEILIDTLCFKPNPTTGTTIEKEKVFSFGENRISQDTTLVTLIFYNPTLDSLNKRPERKTRIMYVRKK